MLDDNYKNQQEAESIIQFDQSRSELKQRSLNFHAA